MTLSFRPFHGTECHEVIVRTKRRYALAKVYGLLEPGPVILLTTGDGKRSNVMAQSWHMMVEFEPPLVACVVSDRNFSFRLLKATGQCGINIPTAEIAKKVVQCGNASGRSVSKFEKFGLTPVPASVVKAPLIAECFASLECRVVDSRWVRKYGVFVLEVVRAWVDPSVKAPRTMHHRGNGRFMLAGRTVRLRSRMR